MQSLGEVLELLDEMRALFDNDEDAAKVAELAQMRSQIAAACRQREAHMMELMRGAARGRLASSRADQSRRDDAARGRGRAASDAAGAARSACGAGGRVGGRDAGSRSGGGGAGCAERRSERGGCGAGCPTSGRGCGPRSCRRRRPRQRRGAEARAAGGAGPAFPLARSKPRAAGAHASHRKHAALYPLLTGLQWDFDAPPGRWKGRVLDAAGGDVRPFNLGAEGATPVSLADSLWALI